MEEGENQDDFDGDATLNMQPDEGLDETKEEFADHPLENRNMHIPVDYNIRALPDIDNYTRIDFGRVNVETNYDSTGLKDILETTPVILADPNDRVFMRHIDIPDRLNPAPPTNTRSQFCKTMMPMITVETLAEMSTNFFANPQVTRQIWKKPQFEPPETMIGGTLMCFEFKFQTTEEVFKKFQVNCSKSIWLMHSIKDTAVSTNIKGHDMLISRSVFVFINSFFLLEDSIDSAKADYPVWEGFDGKPLSMDAKMFIVQAKGYFESLVNVNWLQEIDAANYCHLTFVSQVIMHTRFSTMVHIPEFPSGSDPNTDYNVSPVYDSIVGHRAFKVDYCLANETLEEKFNKFCADEQMDNKHSFLPKLNLVVGVPGSGKTSNTVKPVGNYLTANPEKRILMCAPSNAACDVFFAKIRKEFPKLTVCRVGNYKHFTKTGFCEQMEAEKTFKCEVLKSPNMQAALCAKYNINSLNLIEANFHSLLLQEAQLVISTLGSSQCDELISMRNADFSTLIIDESTQAQLVELLLPLHFTSIRRVMLIGDPFQLGPVCSSRIFTNFALDRCSLFINLFTRYGNEVCTSRLTRQFRMHPIVAKLIQEISYFRGNIQIQTDTVNGSYKKLVGQHPPLLVLSSNEWQDVQSPNSHSRKSEKEAKTGIILLKASLRIARFDFEKMEFPPDVQRLTYCIIPLYRGQVELFEKLLKREKLDTIVNVYTVDQMQGSECDIAIVSAVRASAVGELSIGFASEIRRLNVALSRAGAVYVLAQHGPFKAREGWSKLFLMANCFDLAHSKAELLRDHETDMNQQYMYDFLRRAGQSFYPTDVVIPALDRFV